MGRVVVPHPTTPLLFPSLPSRSSYSDSPASSSAKAGTSLPTSVVEWKCKARRSGDAPMPQHGQVKTPSLTAWRSSDLAFIFG